MRKWTMLSLVLLTLVAVLGLLRHSNVSREAGEQGAQADMHDEALDDGRSSSSHVQTTDFFPHKQARHAFPGARFSPWFVPQVRDSQRSVLRGREIGQKLLDLSELIAEEWSEKDAVGNRTRTAIYRTEHFKYPMLRAVEFWSGKTGEIVNQEVMVASHLIVKPDPAMDHQRFVDQIEEMGFQAGRKVGQTGLLVSFEQQVEDPAEMPRRIGMLSEIEGLVEYAEPDFLVWPALVPNDPDYAAGRMWGLDNPGRTNGYTEDADIDAPEAWELRTGAPNIIVSVTDTGTRYDHVDLAGNMWINSGEIAGDGIDNDGNGTVDDVYGLDAYDNDGDPMDEQGHGTHCAGTIGAVGNNSIGLTGVAWDVQLMTGRFLGPFGGSTSDAIDVVDYSRVMGADIISASWGGGGYSHALRDAIAACALEGIPFVAAAGNSGTNNDAYPHYPSSYEVANVIAVAATDGDDFLTDFSCYGTRSVDLAAPGWQIWSSYYNTTSSYKFLMGTSMATPHVSGALALAMAEFPDANLEELIARLYRSVDPIQRVILSGGGASRNLWDIDGPTRGRRRNTGGYQRVTIVDETRLTTGGRLNLYNLLTMAGPYLTNDQFATPHELFGDYDVWSGGNRDATREADEGDYSPTSGNRSIWFTWEAPYDGYATVRTNSLGAGQQIVAFTGDSKATLQVLRDSGVPDAGESETIIRFDAVAGTRYTFVTDSGSPAGELFDLTLRLVAANDLLSQAIVLEGESWETIGSNRGATAQPFELDAPHAGVGAGKSVWYQWTAPLSGNFSINTDGSDTDTVIAVYTGDPLNPSGFTAIASNDDVDASSRWSRADFTASSGVTYYIAVDCAQGTIPGPYIMRGAAPAAPIIVQEPLDQTIPLGDRCVFQVAVDGTAPFTYQWFKDGEAIPGAWDTSLVIDPVTLDSLATYKVEVTNTYGTTSSRDALLLEKRFPPTITWTSGNQACLVGQDLTLGVLADGSLPFSYSWTKDGTSLPGETQSTLAITGAVTGDAGVYACTVTNDKGSATASMNVSVLTNPFESFTGVRDAAPNSQIMDLQVIDGKCYAVAGTRVLVSDDGEDWQDWLLPSGFDGSAITKLGSNWYCSGYTADGDLTMAISNDGVNWNVPVPVVGVIADSTSYTQEPIAQLAAIDGRLVAAVTPRNQNGSTWYTRAVYYSTDGINWSACQLNTLSATTVDLRMRCRMQLWNGKLYAPSDSTTSSVLISSDGITWDEVALPDNGSGSTHQEGYAIGTHGSKLVLMHKRGPYTTDDGVVWTMEADKYDSTRYYGRKLVSTGAELYTFGTWGGLDMARFSTTVDDWENFFANPGDQYFTAAVEFDGAVICGTRAGVLRRIESREDFSIGIDAAYPFASVIFLNDEFLAYRDGGADPKDPVYVSGDGRRWRAMDHFHETLSSTVYNAEARIHVGQQYFSQDEAGLVPAFMSQDHMPAGVTSAITMASDGSSHLVISSSTEVHSVSLDGTVWTPLSPTGLFAGSSATMVHFNGRWLIANGSSVYQSVDGESWSQVSGATGSYITEMGGKVYTINSNASTLYESSDGINWTSQPTGISVGSEARQSSSASVSLLRMGVFDDKLIVLVSENHTWRSFAFFSDDGVNWFNGNVPNHVVDFAVGLGSLVGVTSTGGVFVAGGTGAGGAAPVVDIQSPVHKSTHVYDTVIKVTGTAIDPEGQAVTTECFLDGVSIGSSSQSPFSFDIRATSATGHVVSIRSEDPSGLVGSDEIKVTASAPELRNSLESEEGVTYLPQMAWTSFGDRMYAASRFTLYRANRDGTWESVLMPSFDKEIVNIVSGNGTLILQTQNRTYVTRDGYSWTELSVPAGGSIYFSGGYFITTYSLGGSLLAVSRDGLSWDIKKGSSQSVPIISAGGVMFSMPSQRSIDGGDNWIPIPDLQGHTVYTLQFCSAFGSVFAGLADGRVMRSDDEGLTWAQVASFDPLPSGHQVRLAYHAGRLWWGGGGFWKASSSNGASWQVLQGEVLQSSLVEHFDGRFVGFGLDQMVWSANGHVWKAARSGPGNPTRGMIGRDGGKLLLGDGSQGVWSSTDGRTWDLEMPGLVNTEAPVQSWTDRTTRITVDGRLVHGGSPNGISSTFLWYADNEGLSWKKCTFNGSLFEDVEIHKLVTDGDVAFAITTRKLPEGNSIDGLWRSMDGLDWEQVWDWPGGTIASLDHKDGVWACLGEDGEFHTTSDYGDNWSADLRPAGFLSGRTMTSFDGVWVLIGAEVANLAGPNVVHTSPDGTSWTAHGAPGGETHYAKLSHAKTADALVIVSNSGKVFTTHDSNLVWTETATTSANWSNGYEIERVGGLFNIKLRMTSPDGVTWTTYSSSTGPSIQFNGLYLSYEQYRKPRWSVDGNTWNDVTEVPWLSTNALYYANDSHVRVRNYLGETWETSDGQTYTRVLEGVNVPSATAYGRRIIDYGGRLIVAGAEGMALYSDDDGESWNPSLLNGNPFPISLSERDLEMSPNELLASYHYNTNVWPPDTRHFRSVDGIVWTEIPEMETQDVMGYAWGDGIWMAIRANGGLLSSNDGGQTWADAGSIAGVEQASRIAYYNGVWVVAATTTTVGSYPPLNLFTSPDGVVWTDRGDSGSFHNFNRIIPPDFFTAHGKLIFGRQPSDNSTAEGPVMASIDGVTWAELGIGGNAYLSGYSGKTFIPVGNGFIAIGGATTNVLYWEAPASGGEWNLMPSIQNHTQWIGTPDGERVFLFGNGSIKQWAKADLEMTLAEPTLANIGVGDDVAIDVTLENRGSESITAPVRVDAWLSTDRFFGDGNDTYVGWDTWDGSVPAPTTSAMETMNFTLPNTVRPGSFYLILKLNSDGSFAESNLSNNVAVTESVAVDIAQRRLDVVINGNGSVNTGINARYHAHGARVSIMAIPGKGARFSGWSGDAVGPDTEALVIMSSDRNVEASFDATAILTSYTRGGGQVVQSAGDGVYDLGATAGLTAVPATGWTFSGWSGGLSSANASETLLMDANKAVTARFIMGYEAWKGQRFTVPEQSNSAISDALADPDFDGLQNWREWLRGSDPKNNSDRGKGTLRREGKWLIMNYTRMENMPAGHSVNCRASADLQNWNAAMEERVISSKDGVETLEVRMDVTGMPRAFFQVVDVQP